MLKLGFVSVVRPLFKGESQRAAERSLERLKDLGEELRFEVVTPSVSASDLETSQKAAGELSEMGLDFLLIQHTTFATGDLLAPLLHAARRVGVWALPESSGGRGQTGPLPLNALCGLNMTMSFLEHPEVAKREPVKWFYGEAGSSWFRSRLLPTLAALRGLKAIEGSRILQIGGTAPAFYGIEERPELASVTVETKELAELFERAAAVPGEEAAARAEVWAQEERLEAPLEHLQNAARLDIVLNKMAQEGDYHALALRCWPELPNECGAMACAAVGRLGDREIPAACEGDVMGALSMLALQGMSALPAILMDLSDVDGDDDSLLFWHCGNAPRAWAGEAGTRLTTHFNRDTLGVVRDMKLRPGFATGFRLLEGGRRALIVSGAFSQPSKAGFDGVRGWLSDLRWNGEKVRAETLVANVLDHRLPHHFAFGAGEFTEGLGELCGYLGSSPLPLRPLRHTL